MITADQFQSKYESTLPPTKLRCSGLALADSVSHQVQAMDMLLNVFPQTTAQRFLMGDGKYQMGGLVNLYGNAAVFVVYETIMFYLKTGWWEIGFDKGSLHVEGQKFRKLPYQELGHPFENSEIIARFNNETILATTVDSNFFYAMALVKNPELLVLHEQMFHVGQFTLHYEDCNYIGNGFSSVKSEKLLEIMVRMKK